MSDQSTLYFFIVIWYNLIYQDIEVEGKATKRLIHSFFMAKPSFCINIMRTDIYENDIRHRVRAFFSSDKSSCQDRLRKV